MKAIVVAAGLGSRLQPYTDDRPKCMVDIGGRPILGHQLDAYRANGVSEIHVVRGYLGERIDLPGITLHENPEYRSNNILLSLMYAESAMDGGFLCSYGDIVFTKDVVAKLVASTADFALVVDRKWKDVYVGRDLHPIGEAEVAEVAEDGRVLRAGKRICPEERAHGEYIGLCRMSARAASLFRAEFHRLRNELGDETPFGTAPRFRSAYVTDLFNHLIENGERMESVDIDGGWREIDTTQDLERARALVAL